MELKYVKVDWDDIDVSSKNSANVSSNSTLMKANFILKMF